LRGWQIVQMVVRTAVMEMTASHCRGARGLLGWSQEELAKASKVGLSTIYDFEKSRRSVSPEKIQAIRIALEIAGVMFDVGDGGVKLRKRR
jgi:transcriptional regulator with XRE-family HTH domain